MKPTISLFALLMFLVVSCDSPVGDIHQDNHSSELTENLLSEIPAGVKPEQADSIRKVIWKEFRDQNGKDWKITWSKRTGLPRSLFSGTTEPVQGAPEQAARTFLAQHRSLFGMSRDLADLQLIEVGVSSRDIRNVRFQQTYKGVPVFDATWQVHIRPDGRIDMANGHYYPDIDIPTTPSVPASSARQTTLADLGGQIELNDEIETELMVYPSTEDNSYSLVWNVQISAGEPDMGEWRYFVDARNGQILDKLDMIATVTGDGDIIEEHPDLTPNPVNEDLYRLDGSGYLRGTYANVHNHITSRAYSSINSFQYNINDDHFDEVNVYYHIDTYRAGYLSDLGFNKNIGSDQDLEAWVHDLERPNEAYYNPNRDQVRFGHNIDYAKEDKIIYHEFIHAVADVENGSHYLDPNDDEEGAIGEGIADYFAGSHTTRSRIGEYCCPGADRNMADPDITSYTQYQNEFPVAMHDGGEFFSAILWDLRNQGGISIHDADVIVFEAISRLSGAPDFMEYRDAMMAVDSDINGGANNDLIQDTFYFRGLGTYSLTANISGPGLVREGMTETWTGSGSGGSTPYTNYTWNKRATSSDPWSYVGSGSQYSETISSRDNFQLRVCVTDAETITRCSDPYEIFVK